MKKIFLISLLTAGLVFATPFTIICDCVFFALVANLIIPLTQASLYLYMEHTAAVPSLHPVACDWSGARICPRQS